MQSRKPQSDRGLDEGGWLLIGALLVAGLALYAYPQVLGSAFGMLAAGIHPLKIEGEDERRHWRSVAGWSIGAGITLAAAFVLLSGPLGADVEMRRFNRNWGPSHLDPSALAAHPWAWVPLGVAAALAAYGVALLYRNRRK